MKFVDDDDDDDDAVLTVLCYFALPSRSGSRTLTTKDTFY